MISKIFKFFWPTQIKMDYSHYKSAKLSNGEEIYYSLTGNENNKSKILLVHGDNVASSSWEPVLPLLEKHFRVLNIDLRGFGKSSYNK